MPLLSKYVQCLDLLQTRTRYWVMLFGLLCAERCKYALCRAAVITAESGISNAHSIGARDAVVVCKAIDSQQPVARMIVQRLHGCRVVVCCAIGNAGKSSFHAITFAMMASTDASASRRSSGRTLTVCLMVTAAAAGAQRKDGRRLRISWRVIALPHGVGLCTAPILAQGNRKVSTLKLKSNAPRLRDPGQRLAPAGWRGNKSSGQRGYDYEWQCYRRDYLAVHPLCAIRGEGCTLAATVVDHIKPHRGDQALFSDPENHQPACAHCHSMHKQRVEVIDNRG